MDLSVVVPLLNEEQNLLPLHAQLHSVLSALDRSFEIIFIDDGSTDDSFTILEKLHRESDHVKVLQFRRNFGRSAALSAGFSVAQGDVVITMDADLQDDPHEIPRFLSKLDEGYDLVSGWKHPRRDPLSKNVPSKLFNFVTRRITGVNLHDFNCGFKAYRNGVVRELEIYGELHRYILVLAHWKGYRIAEIKIHHHPRRFGRSKFGLNRFSRGFFDIVTVFFLTQYTRRPLHLFGWFGSLSFFAGLLINAYLTVLWLTGYRPIGNRPLLMLGVLLLIIGVQFFSLGLLAELITKASPTSQDYSVRKKLL